MRALRLDGLQPIGCSVEAVATMIGCFPTQALAFSPVFIQTQRTQRKRLRLDGNRAEDMARYLSVTIDLHHAKCGCACLTGSEAARIEASKMQPDKRHHGSETSSAATDAASARTATPERHKAASCTGSQEASSGRISSRSLVC